MTKYDNSKIYKIEPISEHDPHEIYIGSTTKEKLCQRMAYHRGDYKMYKKGNRGKIMAFDLFDKYGIENCQIILIEECKCNSKDELIARESFYIRNSECINKFIPDRTKKERMQQERYKVKNAEYQKTDKRKEYLKNYIESNKDNMKEKRKIYREQNKEKLNDQNIKRYHENKEEINKQRAIKIECECGCTIRKADISKHRESLKHVELMKEKEQN